MTGPPPDELAALLAEPPEGFVAARTARVRALKAEGRKDEAAALAAVRKPVRLVWGLGELARRHHDEAEAAVAAADAVAEPPEGESTRTLLRAFRDAVDELAALAPELELDPATVGLALRAVLADADARTEWAEGRLLALPEEGSGAVAPRRPSPRPDPAAAPAAAAARPRLRSVPTGPDLEAQQAAEEAERAARAEAEAAEEAERAALAEAEASAEAAEAAIAEAEDALARRREEVEEAQRAVAAAEDALREARERAKAAGRERDRARRRSSRSPRRGTR